MFELNMDIKTRDEIIFGEYNPDAYSGGCRHFDYLDAPTLRKLIDMGFADPEEEQNSSPTIEEFLEFVENHDEYVLGGYVVTDQRDDYRVSITDISKDGEIETMDELKEFIEFARFADDFDPSGYAWWD